MTTTNAALIRTTGGTTRQYEQPTRTAKEAVGEVTITLIRLADN